MKIRTGYELIFDCPQAVPMILMLNIHPSRAADIIEGDKLTTDPMLSVSTYYDGFGNFCTRLTAPAGRTRISGSALIKDAGAPDPAAPEARQLPVEELPDETLVYLLGSRYCETDELSDVAGLFNASDRLN